MCRLKRSKKLSGSLESLTRKIRSSFRRKRHKPMATIRYIDRGPSGRQVFSFLSMDGALVDGGSSVMPDTDSDSNLGTDIRPPKIGTVIIGDPDLNWNSSLSPCNGNTLDCFCTVPCIHQVWCLNPSGYLSPFPAM